MTIKDVLAASSLKGSKSTAVLLAVTVVLGISLVGLSSKTYFSYQEAESIKAERAKMERTIKDFQRQAELISEQQYRPVDEDQVPMVQSDILLAAQNYHLKLNNLALVSDKGKDKGNQKTFTLEFSGSYNDTINFLHTFGSKDALVNILTLTMTPQKGTITTSLKYRIYTKSEVKAENDKKGGDSK